MLKLLQNLLAGESDKESASKTTAIEPVSPDSVESQIIQANNLWQQGKLGEAIIVYSQAIKQNPESSEIYEYLSALLKQQFNIAEAYEKLATDLKNRGNIELAASYYRQAIALKALTGDTKQKLLKPNLVKGQKNVTAIAELKEEAFSFQPLSYSSLTTNYYHQIGRGNNFHSARQVKKIDAEQALSIDWETAQVYLQQALDFCQQKQWESAAQACQKAIATIPDMAEAYKIWGNVLQRMGNTAEAMKCYAKAVEIQPDLAEVYAGIGDVYFNQQKWQLALEYYQKALIINPNPQIYRSTAYVCQQLGEFKQAQININKALELESTKGSTLENISKESIDSNNFESGVDLNSNNIKSSEDSVKIYHQIAQKLEKQNRWQEAAIYYRKALELSISQPVLPAQTKSERQLASLPEALTNHKIVSPNSHSNQQSIIEDLNLLNSQVKQNLQPAESKESHRLLRRKSGQTPRRRKRADPTTTQAVGIHVPQGHNIGVRRLPSNGGKTKALAAYNADQDTTETARTVGQIDKAIRRYYQQAQLQPNSASIHSNLGNLYGRKRQWNLAIACYRQAIQIDPQYAPAHLNFARSLAKIGKEKEFIQEMKQALKLQPDIASAIDLYYLGNALLKQDKQDEAISFYYKAIVINPHFVQAYHRLGEVLNQQERHEDAIEFYQKAVRYNPEDAELYYSLGQQLTIQKNWNAAVKAYTKVLQLNPRFPNAPKQLNYALAEKLKSDLANKHK